MLKHYIPISIIKLKSFLLSLDGVSVICYNKCFQCYIKQKRAETVQDANNLPRIYKYSSSGLGKGTSFGPVSRLNSKSGPGSGFKIKFFSRSKIFGPGCPVRCRALFIMGHDSWPRQLIKFVMQLMSDFFIMISKI